MDHLTRSLLNTYSAQPLARASLERKETDWLASQSANALSEYLILEGHNVVTANRVPVILSYNQFHSLAATYTPMLLGLKKSDGVPVYAVNIPESESVLNGVESITTIETHSLRELSADIDADLAAMLCYATMLNHWHLNTRFCARCGSPLEVKEGGALQQCSNNDCAHSEYPRINSAVIMRVTKDHKILLARQEQWPDKMYSVLAGFVEVGETLEHAVAREVMEEVSLTVENINYHSSQPWPFPNALMLGYTAEATSYELDFEQDDIEHALWLSADELTAKMQQGSIVPSSGVSISHRLIDDWFQDQTGMSLKEFNPPFWDK